MNSDNRTTITTDILNQNPSAPTAKLKTTMNAPKKALKPLSLRPTKSVKKNSSFKPSRTSR